MVFISNETFLGLSSDHHQVLTKFTATRDYIQCA